MRIARHLLDELVSHAQDEAPLECCGIIASMDGRAVECYRARNAAESEVRFEIDGPDQQRIQARLDRLGLTLAGIYHSHTVGPAYPSAVDVEMAFYPDALYVIVGVQDRDFPEVRAYRIRDSHVSEEALEVRG